MVREDVSGRTESYRRIFYVLTITVLPIVSSGIYNCSNVVDNYLFGQGHGQAGVYGVDSIATYWGADSTSCSLIYRWLFPTPFILSDTVPHKGGCKQEQEGEAERIATPSVFPADCHSGSSGNHGVG